MESEDQSPAGVLVVTAWFEGEPPLLRARITATVDTASGEPERTYAADAEQVVRVVRAWLDALGRTAGGDGPAPP